MARSTATEGPHLERAHSWRQTHCTKHRAAPHYREHHSCCNTKQHLVIRNSKIFLTICLFLLFLALEISGDEAFTQTPAPGMCSATSIVIIICYSYVNDRHLCSHPKTLMEPQQSEAVPASVTLEPAGPGVSLWWSVWPRL